MLISIISAYTSTANRVVCLSVGQAYIFPYRLTGNQAEELAEAVNDARQIETDRWEKI